MLYVRYRQVCDVCGVEVALEETEYNMCSHRVELPLPRPPMSIGNIQVCVDCLRLAMEPIYEKLKGDCNA